MSAVSVGCGSSNGATSGPKAVTPKGTNSQTTEQTSGGASAGSSSTGSSSTETTTTNAGDVSYVATANESVDAVAVFESPGGPSKSGDDSEPLTISNPNENDVPAVFLVVEPNVLAPDGTKYHKVDLPVRPNGSTGWIKDSDVTISYHSYRIEIELAKHTLRLFEGGTESASYPIGVGTSDTPTPGGVFYIKELLKPPDPDGPYGTYAYGLSGFSTVLDSFAGGDGVVGIHGTNDESAIGKDVSHGCIRLRNADIEALAAKLPLGVPVEIRA